MDLLVSFAYAAAAEKVLDEPLPTGMGLRVRIPEKASSSKVVQVGSDGLCDFDDLDIHQVRRFHDASIFEGQTQTSGSDAAGGCRAHRFIAFGVLYCLTTSRDFT